MEYSLFLSARDCGQSEFALHVARLMVDSGKNVLVIDMTKNQNVRYHFCLNNEIEMNFDKGNQLIICREGIDILICNPMNLDQTENLNLFKVFDFSEYELILVVADNSIETEMFMDSTNTFIFQDLDNRNLIENKMMIDRLTKNCSGLNYELVIRDFLKCKMKRQYILGILGDQSFKGIEIPYKKADYIERLNAKLTGKLNFNRYSKGHIQAVKKIVERISCEHQGS